MRKLKKKIRNNRVIRGIGHVIWFLLPFFGKPDSYPGLTKRKLPDNKTTKTKDKRDKIAKTPSNMLQSDSTERRRTAINSTPNRSERVRLPHDFSSPEFYELFKNSKTRITIRTGSGDILTTDEKYLASLRDLESRPRQFKNVE